ncbi:S-adenosyl-L-methionine-dependent methyltransferase [Helicostylum pulchrum]|nr:S-adenosyl-L-methionine-dependent methyltransferase [Helicostylum pulchrum]
MFSARSKNTQTKSSSGSTTIKSKVLYSEDSRLIEPKFLVKQFDYLEGRNYRQSDKPNESFMPCDDEEFERLQVNYLLFRSIFASQFFAPIEESLKKGIKVLEVSTGPGWWLMGMAKDYPRSHFTGVDLMIYPITLPPKNCHFRVLDMSKGLPYADNTFDFVAQHDTLYRYSQKDWDCLIPEMIRVTKPGGYIELVENGGVFQDIGPNMSIWTMRLAVSLQTRGINLKNASTLSTILEGHEQLEVIHSSHRSTPVGWYGKTGDIALDSLDRLFYAVKPKVCEDWSMSPAKYDKVTKAASAECKDFRSWVNIHYLVAAKKW